MYENVFDSNAFAANIGCGNLKDQCTCEELPPTDFPGYAVVGLVGAGANPDILANSQSCVKVVVETSPD